jgi:hypothetical protein
MTTWNIILAARTRPRLANHHDEEKDEHRGACWSERTLQLSPGRASREQEDAGVTRTVIRA